jgi:FkbM family methyltransferase
MEPIADGAVVHASEITKRKNPVLDRALNLHARVFGRPVFRKLNYLLLQLGLRGIGVSNYQSAYLSGEDAVARKIVHSVGDSDGFVLDIGANEGEFTDLVVKDSKRLRVMSFEPHPVTYARLKQRFARNPRVEIVNCAVGREPGEIDLYDYEEIDGTEHATVFRDVIEKTRRAKASKHTVKMVTLDALEIDGKIELIKVDVEGFELAVLQGARKVIANKRPNYLLVEFNEMNITSRTFLQEIFDELKGYKAERILPGGKTLELNNPYRPWHHEIFAYQNLLFTRLS